MAKVHEGVCGHHLIGRLLARKLLWAGCYQPTMKANCMKYVQDMTSARDSPKCTLLPHKNSQLRQFMVFLQVGMDLLSSFPQTTGQHKYLVVVVDYFTKLIKAELLAKITVQKIVDFTWKSIMCRFGLPFAIVIDNGTQFTDKNFKAFCDRLGIR